MDDERGKIKNRNYANQVKDYSGLRYGNKTPTDIDGMLEYNNICYVFIETKFENASMPFGQKLALERLCDDMSKVKPTLLIISSHNSVDDIDMANTTVTEYRYKGVWKPTKQETITKELVDYFVNMVQMDHDLG